VLDAELANQIAAGEVVENPASVVKELVENALDAEASRITVVVEGAGIDRLQIVDDGVGMTNEDAVLALERHATSKIGAAEDLSRIVTLGFRGEALPSIASVSRLVLRTKPLGALKGTKVECIPGEPLASGPAGCPEGTSVEVRDLFFNTPARRKFLKSPSAETARITEQFNRLALSRPGVGFTLSRGGRTTRAYLPRGRLFERVQEVVGSGVELREASGDVGSVHVESWVTGPERSRVGARGLHLLVNGRLVRDPGLLRAVWVGYDGTLDHGHYPLGLVSVTLDPKLLDVNVHPQKAEVRFIDRGAVHSTVIRVVGSVVRRGFVVPEGTGSRHAGEGAPPSYPTGGVSEPLLRPLGGGSQSGPFGGGYSGGGLPPSEPIRARPSALVGVPFASLRYLGSAGRAWLVCEGPDGLVIIDQHAAHERITFERLREGMRKEGGSPAQRLLVPEQAEVSPTELEELDRRGEELRAMGFEVEPFSTTAVTITAVPAPLVDADPRRLLDEVLGEISGLRAPLADSMDALLARLACHGSIRAGTRIAREEVAALLEGLDEAELGGHCPHGRPVTVEVPWLEVERRLGRR